MSTKISERFKVTARASLTTFTPYLRGRNIYPLLPRLTTSVFFEFSLPPNFGGAFIGQRGSNIQYLKNIENVIWACVLDASDKLVIGIGNKATARSVGEVVSELVLVNLPISGNGARFGTSLGNQLRACCRARGLRSTYP